VAEIPQAAAEGVHQPLHLRVGRGGGREEADPRDLPCRLRPGREWPGEQAAGQAAEERASIHQSSRRRTGMADMGGRRDDLTPEGARPGRDLSRPFC